MSSVKALKIIDWILNKVWGLIHIRILNAFKFRIKMFHLFKMSKDFCCFGGIYLKLSLFSEELETSFENEKLFHGREVIF